MFVTLLVILSAGEALCQYVSHPLGGFSYTTNTNFHQAVGYSYVAPTGQKVNVKFATGASVEPPYAHVSATSQFSAPRFVFHSAAAPAPLSLNPKPPYVNPEPPSVNPAPLSLSPEPQQYQIFQPSQVQPEAAAFLKDFRAARPADPPRPESLFVPANGVGPVQSEKQLQAYDDYVKKLAEENARTATESPSSGDFDPESLLSVEFNQKNDFNPESFVSVEFGENRKAFA